MRSVLGQLLDDGQDAGPQPPVVGREEPEHGRQQGGGVQGVGVVVLAQDAVVAEVVTRVLVPGSYARCDGTLMLNGPSRKAPACWSSSAPNRLGESNRGTHSQSTVPSGATSAQVWQLERKA